MASRCKISRKTKAIFALVALPFVVYVLSLIWIHASNARHDRVWGRLYDHARATDIPVRPRADDLGLIHFYDESQPYRAGNGLTYHMQGFVTESGDVAIPPTYSFAHKQFCAGLAFVETADGRAGFIRPDESWAFDANFDHVDSFVNGMALVRNELPSELITPVIRSGFINKQGVLAIPIKYRHAREFVGEFTLASKGTVYSGLYDRIMDGVDVALPPVHWFFPPRRHVFLDKQGAEVSPADVADWILADRN